MLKHFEAYKMYVVDSSKNWINSFFSLRGQRTLKKWEMKKVLIDQTQERKVNDNR